MFLLWAGFSNKFTQMYGDTKEKETATKKLYKLKQTSSVIVYTTKF